MFLLSKGSSAASTTADLVKTSDAALAKPAINILDKINGLLNKANKTVKVQEESDRFLDAAVDDWINSEKTAKAGAELKWPETIEEALDLPPKPQKPDLELPHLAGNSAKGYTEGAGVSLRTDDITSIYRAVGPNEYYSVVGSGKFDTVPTGMEVKQFGLDMQDTINFAERYPNIAAVLEVKIPKGILNNIGDFTKVDTTIFKNGTVTIQPENLDIFNKYLKEILHIY